MSIAPYLRDIGRGRDGARALNREQAADLFGQVLDGRITDLEVGAFCLAMRVKGETPDELAGFVQATQARLAPVTAPPGVPVVVLPSYNGARRLPLFTPLLGLLLAQRGCAVLLHSCATEDRRVTAAEVLAELGVPPAEPGPLAAGRLSHIPTGRLCPALERLLQVRRVVGLRNPAHSVVKLLNPVTPTSGGAASPVLVVGSYTHPEYATSMGAAFALLGTRALLLRGTEGEPVADPRRAPRMEAWCGGQPQLLHDSAPGSIGTPPELPAPDARATAEHTRRVLAGDAPLPEPLALQIRAIETALTLPAGIST